MMQIIKQVIQLKQNQILIKVYKLSNLFNYISKSEKKFIIK